MSSRREAIYIVTRWLATGDFPGRLLSDSPERAFITDMVYNTVRRRRTLEWALRHLVKKMPGGESGAALLVGACQLLFMPDVAAYAAVNETVEAAKLASRQSAGLVNGVLRNMARRRAELLELLASEPLGVRASHPEALVTRWVQRLGAEEAERLCAWNNQPAVTWLAVAPGAPCPLTPPVAAHEGTPDYYPLPRGARVEEVTGYATGAFIVQEPASAAALKLLDIQPGQRVLDGCAAPGGKSAQIAWRLGAEGGAGLVALDLHEDRLEALRDTLQRTGHDRVRVEQGDLAGPAAALKPLGLFDRILIDAPCSNTGVLGRRPDARWRWSARHMRQLVQTQAAMLENGLKMLAPGGLLVYSTCSLEPEENRRQIARLRQAHPEVACAGVIENIPTRTQTDGSFACALRRETSAGQEPPAPGNNQQNENRPFEKKE